MMLKLARELSRDHTRALRVVGWLCVLLLVWLSWIPREWQTRTSLSGQIEHAIAYCGTAITFTLGYMGLAWWRIAGPLVVLAAILEIGQLWIPGRTSQFIDFAASGTGAVAGGLIGVALVGWLLRSEA